MNPVYLQTLDLVIASNPDATRDPVQHLTDSGVDPGALDEFVFDCIATAMNAGVPGNRVMHMIACSCFHMGMLTQRYIDEKNASS